jgi:hypothetical protein
MTAEDQDVLLNMLIGIKELYNARFDATFRLFETLVHDGTIASPNLQDVERKWNNLYKDVLDSK